MALHVLENACIRTYRFSIDDHPRTLQASLSVEACGDLPMRWLRFRFYRPDGALLHEVCPGQGSAAGQDLPGRIRQLPLALRMESLVRKALRRRTVLRLDLPPACLAQPALAVSVENLGRAPIALGSFRLRTSTLAPDRLVRNAHAIEGYGERVSVCPGERLQLFVHAPLLRFGLSVIRHGAGDELVLQRDGIAGKPQHYPANAYQRGAGWDATFALEIGEDWRSGLYSARIADASGAAFDITFIVRKPKHAAGAGLAVLASTNTWLAYNAWGGASLYRYDIDDGLGKSSEFLVHMQRPNPAASMAGDDGHLANAERHILRWLERNGIAYDLYADIDLHQAPDLLRQHPTLLISTHSEYWTVAMYAGLEKFLDAGGNLVYLSGNGLYWKTEIRAQQLEVRYDGARHVFSGEAGGRWRDCGRPETKVLGMRFTLSGYKSAYKPYRVITPGHWIYDGTGVRKGSLVGRFGLNMGGASGWEMDKIDRRCKPAGLVHLAKGTNRWRCGADMTYFTHAGGGGVFSAGSITFGGSLAIDPVLGRMLRNVLARFSQAPAGQGMADARPAPQRVDAAGTMQS